MCLTSVRRPNSSDVPRKLIEASEADIEINGVEIKLNQDTIFSSGLTPEKTALLDNGLLSRKNML